MIPWFKQGDRDNDAYVLVAGVSLLFFTAYKK
jgi:hypothetical protein